MIFLGALRAPISIDSPLEIISKDYNMKIPNSIKSLFSAKINHNTVINKQDIEEEITKFIRK